jgi:endonuclease-3
MQYELPFEGVSRLPEIHRRLTAAYGPPPAAVRLDPVSQLIRSMLGARTYDAVSNKAFAALANRCARWEDLIHMPCRDLLGLIRNVTFPENKAKHIPLALQTIIERHGRLELDFLSAWPVKSALAWLDRLPGTGPKTSAAVLNFSTLDRRALVVDTHYWRVACSLGLIPYTSSLAKASRLLMAQIPAMWTSGDTHAHFLLMKRLGQEYCRHSISKCTPCPLRPLCPQTRRPGLHRAAARQGIAASAASDAHGRRP